MLERRAENRARQKPSRQWGGGDEFGPSATDDGKDDFLERFLGIAKKVNELINRGRKLELDPGLERHRMEQDLKGPH